jgi:uncharacterized protein with FMN-binding domain
MGDKLTIMKRVLVSLLVLVGVGGLIGLLSYHPKAATVGSSTSTTTKTPSVAGTEAPAHASSGSSGGMYKDGSYTGTTSDTVYGPVQVQAVISGGKLTSINFLQMPSDRDESVRITSEAKPALLQEAVQVQTANVDTVSGATQDTEGFVQSLQSALSQAKA